MRDIYGAAADAPAFRDAFAAALAALWADGTAATLKRYLAS
jgi:mannitol 2-dehydrogenase